MRRKASILIALVFLCLAAGCGPDPEQQTDDQLHLTPQEAQGRRVYKQYCLLCHSAYSSRSRKGPSLQGLYKKQYLPSGLLANDEFVEQSIIHGRKMMPALGNSLTQQQLSDLMAYLHTL